LAGCRVGGKPWQVVNLVIKEPHMIFVCKILDTAVTKPGPKNKTIDIPFCRLLIDTFRTLKPDQIPQVAQKLPKDAKPIQNWAHHCTIKAHPRADYLKPGQRTAAGTSRHHCGQRP